MDSVNLTDSTIFSYEHVLFFKKTFKDSEIIYRLPLSFQQAKQPPSPSLGTRLPCIIAMDVGLPQALRARPWPGRAAEAGLWPGRTGGPKPT